MVQLQQNRTYLSSLGIVIILRFFACHAKGPIKLPIRSCSCLGQLYSLRVVVHIRLKLTAEGRLSPEILLSLSPVSFCQVAMSC